MRVRTSASLGIGRKKGLQRIVIAGSSALTVSRTVQYGTQVMGWTGYFRRGFHTHTAGKARGDHDAFTAAGGPQFNNTLCNVHLGNASAVDFNIELRATDR